MIVYVLTKGEYSDYHIEGVFTDKSLADLYINSHLDIKTEEYETDVLDEKIKKGYLYFSVLMDANGNTEEVLKDNPSYEDYYRDARQTRLHYKPGYNFVTSNKIPDYAEYLPTGKWRFYIWAKTKEGAVKIANERRTALLLKGEW